MVKRLTHAAYRPVVLDDLSGRRRDAAGAARLVVADLGGASAVNARMQACGLRAAMDFASFIQGPSRLGRLHFPRYPLFPILA